MTLFQIRLRWLAVALLICLSHLSFSQLTQNARLEIPISGRQYFNNLNLGEDGLMVIRSYSDLKRSLTVWDIYHIDTLLNTLDTSRIEYDNSRRFLMQTQHNGEGYFLFANFRDIRLEVIRMSNPEGDTTKYVFVNPFAFRLHDFRVTDHAILLSGYYRERPIILLRELASGLVKVVPGLYNDQSEFSQLKINDNNTFDVVVIEPTPNRRKGVVLRRYSPLGDLLMESRIDPGENSLLFARSINFGNGRSIVTGTYSPVRSELSRGLFAAVVDPTGAYTLRFFNYAELENFFNYMRDGKERRVRRRIERRRIKGRRNKFRYRMMVHNVIPFKDTYVLVGEAFFLKYESNYYSSLYSYTTRAYNYRLLEGFQYTHAVLIGFNRNGELAWDNSFEIKEVLSPDLRQYVYADPGDKDIALVYMYDNNIKTKVIENERVLKEKDDVPLKLKFEGDEIISNNELSSGFERWYGNSYYAYGVQKIRNNRVVNSDVGREVFFVNKITYK